MVEIQFKELQDYLQLEKKLEAQMQPIGNGSFLITVNDVPLRGGWSESKANIHFIAPTGYPSARPDCFWVSPRLKLQNGAIPQSVNDGNPIPGDPIPGRATTWFSWHLQVWNPNTDRLVHYYQSILHRLIPAR
jgi:hypothetical protein